MPRTSRRPRDRRRTGRHGRAGRNGRRGRIARAAMLLTAAAWLLLAGAGSGCRRSEMDHGRRGGEVLDVPMIRVLLTARPVEQVELATTGGGYCLRAGGTVLAEGPAPLPPTVVRREGQSWLVGGRSAAGRELLLLPAPGGHVRLGRTVYRGQLRLVPAGPGRGILVINRLDLENYLAGVLPKELYRDWHIETYRALAVAARTFALYQAMTFGATHPYDLGDSQASQVYGGLSAETPKSRDAVRTTAGVVLAYGPEGRERIFLAQYSACCGGRVNGAYVIRNANRIPPLEGGQVCTDCAACPHYRWPTVRIAKADVFAALAGRYPAARALGGLVRIDVASRTPWGRAVWVDAVGRNGRKVRLRAEDVRLALLLSGHPVARGLYSMNCRIVNAGGAIEFRDGRGFGHGVGLCQWGAEGKAARGWTAERILAFYYPGAKLFRVY
ncbi:MAG: SpoIID/LytB domain-containing protein [Planctomycetes bacterium]|nr:SpoIID/LytB domain-containing protein [Planctomycetota bacterium]